MGMMAREGSCFRLMEGIELAKNSKKISFKTIFAYSNDRYLKLFIYV